MASGSDADTTLPNTSSSRIRVIGQAIDLGPHEVVLDGRADLVEDLGEAADLDRDAVVVAACTSATSSSTRSFTSSWVPSMRASTRARLPSSLRSGGALPSDQYDTTLREVRPRRPARSVSAVPAAATAGSSTDAAVGGDEQDEVRGAGAEGVEQGLVGLERLGAGSSKPPELRCSATLPPKAPATAKTTAARDEDDLAAADRRSGRDG